MSGGVAIFDWSNAGEREVSLAALARLEACPVMAHRLTQLSQAIAAAVVAHTNVAYFGEASDEPFGLCDTPVEDAVAFYKVQAVH